MGRLNLTMMLKCIKVKMHQSSSSMHIDHDDCNVVDRFQTMVEDLIIPQKEEISEPPNPIAQQFYNLLDAAQRPVWLGCNNHIELSVALRLMSIKSDYNISHSCFNEVVQLMTETCPFDNLIPSHFSHAKNW